MNCNITDISIIILMSINLNYRADSSGEIKIKEENG